MVKETLGFRSRILYFSGFKITKLESLVEIAVGVVVNGLTASMRIVNTKITCPLSLFWSNGIVVVVVSVGGVFCVRARSKRILISS